MIKVTLKTAIEQSALVMVELADITLPLHFHGINTRNGDLELHLFQPASEMGRSSNGYDARARSRARLRRGRFDPEQFDVVINVDPNQELEYDPQTGRSMVRCLETGGHYTIYFFDKSPMGTFEKDEVPTTLVEGPLGFIFDEVRKELHDATANERTWFNKLVQNYSETLSILLDYSKTYPIQIHAIELGQSFDAPQCYHVHVLESKDKGQVYDFYSIEHAIWFLIYVARKN